MINDEVLQGYGQRLGYVFRDSQLLLRALTHPSFSKNHYERLEFLGDRILNAIIATILFTNHPNASEGELAIMQANLVRTETLAAVAIQLELSDLMLTGHGEQLSGGNFNKHNLENTMESLVAAIYLDSNYQEVFSWVQKVWQLQLNDVTAISARDSKSLLQEWAQKKGMPLPKYTVLSITGPSHEPEFTVEVAVDNLEVERGVGNSRKVAEHNAAQALLTKHKLL